MKKTLILATLLVGSFILTASAYDEITMEQKTRWFFDRIDTNHDGAISPAEHATFWDQMFAQADSNHDGKVSYDELLAAKKAEHDMFRNVKADNGVLPGEHLPNRTNANPSDHSINKGSPDQPNSKYLNK